MQNKSTELNTIYTLNGWKPDMLIEPHFFLMEALIDTHLLAMDIPHRRIGDFMKEVYYDSGKSCASVRYTFMAESIS